jgi:hypothetical protein
MQILNRGKTLFFVSLICAGCSTSSFKIYKETKGLTEILVTPDRVVLHCEELDEDPDIGAYGFMIHMLDEENTVTTAALNIRPDLKNCENHIRKIKRILQKSERVTIGSHHQLSKQPRTLEDAHFRYYFPGHGTFSSNGRALDLIAIWNEKEDCYNVHLQDDKSCPPFPLPIGKYFNQ